MIKKKLMLLTAVLMMLALFAPAVSAADYPQNGQFIAYYNPEKLPEDTASPGGGTTWYNGAEKAVTSVRTTPRAYDSKDWPLFMYDKPNNGKSPCDGLPSNNGTWYKLNTTDPRSNVANPVIGTVNPIIADGFVFAMTGYYGFDEPHDLINLTCVEEDTNITKWVVDLPRNVHVGSWSSPAYDYDNQFVYAASDNKLYCVNKTGGVEWIFTTLGDTSCNGGPTVGGNWVFCSDWTSTINSPDGPNYYCLNKTDGKVKWIFNTTDVTGMNYMEYAQATPAYESVGGQEYIYVAGWGYDSIYRQAGYIFKINVSDGSMVWGDEQSNQGAFCGSVSIDDNHAFVTSYHFSSNGKLFQYNKTVQNAPTAELNNSVSTERTDATPSIDEDNGYIYVSGGCAGYATPSVTCYRSGDLSVVWRNYNKDMGGWTCSVAIGEEDDQGDKLVFVGRESGIAGVYCYDKIYALYADGPNKGKIKWFYPEGGATAAIANGKVYTTDCYGDMYVFY